MIRLSLSLSLPRLSFRPCSPPSLSVYTSTGMCVYNRSFRQNLETGQGARSLSLPPSMFLLLALPPSLSHSLPLSFIPCPLPKVFRGQTYLLTFVKENIVENPPKNVYARPRSVVLARQLDVLIIVYMREALCMHLLLLLLPSSVPPQTHL